MCKVLFSLATCPHCLEVQQTRRWNTERTSCHWHRSGAACNYPFSKPFSLTRTNDVTYKCRLTDSLEREHIIKVCDKHILKEVQARSDFDKGALNIRYSELLAKEKARADNYPWEVSVALSVGAEGESRIVRHLPSLQCIFKIGPDVNEQYFDARWREFWISCAKATRTMHSVVEEKNICKTFPPPSQAEQGYPGVFDPEIGPPPQYPEQASEAEGRYVFLEEQASGAEEFTSNSLEQSGSDDETF